MNWTYIGIAALLPLAVAMALTLLAGAIQAVRSNREGGSSRIAFRRLLRSMALVFPLAFLATALWDGRGTWKGLIGVALEHPSDQRAMGVLRSRGEAFLTKDPAKGAFWYRTAAEGGDVQAQYLYARALAAGSGTTRNPGAALKWAEAAARQGDSDAMLLAGDLRGAEDPTAANAWYRKIIEGLQARLGQREPQACLTYGFLLYSGKGAPRDPVEGLAWMKVAERRGVGQLQTLTIRMAETRIAPSLQESATRRAEALDAASPR